MPKKNSMMFYVDKPDYRTFAVAIEGTGNGLLVHRFAAKAMIEIAVKQGGAPVSGKRKARDPQQEFEDAMHKLPKGKHGFPAGAFRLSMIGACRLVDGVTMTQARSVFNCPQDFVVLDTAAPEMDTRHVRHGGVTSLRYRPLYKKWKTTLHIRYNHKATTPEQLINLLLLAGEAIGLGELRPGPKQGGHADTGGDTYGTFTVASTPKQVRKS